MGSKEVSDEAIELGKLIGRRQMELRTQSVPHPLLAAFEEFNASAKGLGYDSASALWGATTSASMAMKPHKTPARQSPALNGNGANNGAPHNKVAKAVRSSSKQRYAALITKPNEFIPDDELMAKMLGCSKARVSHIRSELRREGYLCLEVANGYFWSPPEKASVKMPSLESPNGKEDQLPLPTVADAEVTKTESTEKLDQHSPLVSDSTVFWEIKSLLEQMVSEQRQMRGMVAKLITSSGKTDAPSAVAEAVIETAVVEIAEIDEIMKQAREGKTIRGLGLLRPRGLPADGWYSTQRRTLMDGEQAKYLMYRWRLADSDKTKAKCLGRLN